MTCGAVEEHVRRFFQGQQVEAFTWSAGPILSANPHFRALRIAPEHRGGLWHYVSMGGWAATQGQGQGLEFVISTPAESRGDGCRRFRIEREPQECMT